METREHAGYEITITDIGTVLLEDVPCQDEAAAEELAESWRRQDEYEGRCDGEAARRTDHQSDE